MAFINLLMRYCVELRLDVATNEWSGDAKSTNANPQTLNLSKKTAYSNNLVLLIADKKRVVCIYAYAYVFAISSIFGAS